ncbi:hypothetical protein D3C87_2104940 [compost metagenome]
MISPSEGFSTPLMAAEIIGLMLRLATLPSNSSLMPLIAVSVSWPANRPRFSASLTHGVRIGASSAEMDGKLSALVISPLIR